ncbi:MAG: histidine kinase [Mobilicoccus sp.]|nr:histidine kinase [Mobilicoccus sp.]
MKRTRWADGLRTAAYLAYVVMSVLAPIIDADGVLLGLARLLVGVLAVVAVLVRRRSPWWFPAVAVLATPLVGPSLTYAAVVAIVVRRRDRAAVAYAVVAALAAVVPTLWPGGVVQITQSTDPSTGASIAVEARWVEFLTHTAVVGVAYLVGTVIGTRRDLLASYRDRAERAEAERAARSREAVLLERARIAREMHDVLGHKISLLTMQAGALEVNAGAGAAVVEEQAARLRVTAREALGDLRAVIGTLEAADAAPRTPGPGVAEVPALIANYVDAGASVRLADRVSGRADVRTLDPAVSRAVHRVVTESLTNAHRHAPGEQVSLRLDGEPGAGIDLVVENPCQGDALRGDGTGLPGLAERVRLAGGTFEAGRHGGLFRVRARFPWTTEEDST